MSVLYNSLTRAAVGVSQILPSPATDLARHIVEKRDPSAAAGAGWVALSGITGVIRGNGAIRPNPVGAAPDLRFADDIPSHYRFLMDRLGQEHVLYNLLGLGQTALSLSDVLGHYASTVGWNQYFADYRATLLGQETERLPVNGEFLATARAIYGRWFLQYAKWHRLNVLFEGREKIPPEGPVVYAVMPHSSIFPDFGLAYIDPLVAYVADAFNFRDNSLSLHSAFALLGDLFGQPLVDRREGKTEEEKKKIRLRNEMLMEHMIAAGADFGLRAAWFPHGRRVPEAENDDGTRARAGFYSGVIDLKSPHLYIQAGGLASNAVGLAERLQTPVKVGVVTIRGAEFVMPKKTSDAPFIQKNGIGGTIEYRFVEFLDVPVPNGTDRRVTTAKLGRESVRIAKKDLEIDSYLADVTEEWGRRFGYPGTRDIFLERSQGDERFLINADRIRSVPAGIPAKRSVRERLIKEHLQRIHSRSSAKSSTKSDLNPFTREVAEAAVASQSHRSAA